MSDNDIQHPLYPIREVSKKTGVNSVTIRAWERRYGLIKPKRTAKGHRLYNADDIKKIDTILTWLDRGIPISQVRNVLNQPQEEKSTLIEDTAWDSYQADLVDAIENFNENKLDTVYNQALSIYPIDIVGEKILMPVLDNIHKHWQGQFGGQVIHAFIESNLRARLSSRLYHTNRNNDQKQIIICNLPLQLSEIPALIFSLCAANSGFSVSYYNSPVPINEMVLPFCKTQCGGIVFYGNQRINISTWNALKQLQEHINHPISIVGMSCAIHQADILEHRMINLGSQLKQATQHLLQHLGEKK